MVTDQERLRIGGPLKIFARNRSLLAIIALKKTSQNVIWSFHKSPPPLKSITRGAYPNIDNLITRPDFCQQKVILLIIHSTKLAKPINIVEILFV